MKVLSRNNRGEQTEQGHAGQVRRVCEAGVMDETGRAGREPANRQCSITATAPQWNHPQHRDNPDTCCRSSCVFRVSLL